MSLGNPHAARRHAALSWPVLLGVVLALGGCDTLSRFNPFDQSEKYEMKIVPDVPAPRLYDEGLGRLGKSDYEGATKKFSDLEKQNPHSEWSRKALIMTAYANYEGQKWDEAITASKRYIQQYPSSTDAAYAQYIMAMANFNQIPDITRDQDRSEKALEALQALIDKYPKSEYVSDARYRIQVARDQIAGREMEVGRFYLDRRNYTAAINRFRDVVAKYQTTRHVEEALMRLTEAYMALGIMGEAQTAAAVLGHNFPDSPWYKDAYTLLKSGGLEPREDAGSWISRALRGVRKTAGLAG
jgi:outer membrane protein assembly factor BamD